MPTIAGYEIGKVIVEDLKTTTYRARQQLDQSPVVIKLLREEYPSLQDIARLEHEYAITQTLDNAGIVRAYSLEKHQHALVLVQEDFSGVSLRQVLDSGAIRLETGLEIAIQLADVLEVIHQQNIIHKDIRPHSVLVNLQTWQVKLTNFGLASQISYQSQSIRDPHQLEGQLAYISPEQTGRMNRLLDYRTDFYSLGVILYEMVTGTVPFAVTDPLELIHCHIARPPVPPHVVNPAIPAAVSALVLKLLSKTPEERYSSAYGISADLKRCLAAWVAGQALIDFLPGQHDIPFRFQLSQKLYGRDTEIDTLLAAFGALGQGRAVLTLVYGYSGVGKSTLVNEIHKPVIQQKGRFIAGKFDQFKRDLPYSAFIQAFRAAVKQILTEPEVQIAHWKTQFLTAFGSIGQVVVDVIPELELLIGKQPPVPPLAPTETQNRFNFVLQRFVGLFAQPQHPLIIFLDDCQWADSASLNLLQLLVTHPDNQYLLMIGAYRENEVTAMHPLLSVVEASEQNGVTVNRIALNPLTEADITAMIADTLHTTPVRIESLVRLVVSKTGGNPFFVREFLTTLYQENLLTFDGSRHVWQWAIDQIQRVGITDNVADLIVRKLQKLAPATQSVLQSAAYSGTRFDLKTLALICATSIQTTASNLRDAIQEGFIFPLDDAYTLFSVSNLHEDGIRPTDLEQVNVRFEFSHDEVQQAAYSLIPVADRTATHLKIGRLLLEHADAAQLEEEIFAIVNHLNGGAVLIDAASERLMLAHLNLRAGKKAKAATAYALALKYLTVGAELLVADSWQTHYELTLQLYRERAECEFLVENYAQAEKLFDLVLDHAQTNLDQVTVYSTRVNLPAYLGQHEDVIATGIVGLQLLGLKLSSNPSSLILIRELLKTRWYLGRKKVEDLIHLPRSTSLENQAMMNLLINLWGASFWLNRQNLYGAIVLQMFNQSLQFGNTNVSAVAYVCYGALITFLFKDEKNGYKFGELALQLADEFGDMGLKSRVIFIFTAFLNHLRASLTTSVDYFNQAFRYSLEAGDLVYAAYCSDGIITTMPLAGYKLEEIDREAQKRLAFAQRVNPASIPNVLCVREWAAALAGAYPAETMATAVEESVRLAADGKPFGLHYVLQLQVLYLFEQYAKALNVVTILKGNAILSAGQYVPFYTFYHFLTVAAHYPSATSQVKRRYRGILTKCLKRMQAWAAGCPANYQHKYLLMAAELDRLTNQGHAAADLYDAAIEAARQHEFIQEEALANELAAKFYQAKAKAKIARMYLREARYGYLKWGATGKVRHIDEKYAALAQAMVEPQPADTTARYPTITRGLDLDLTSVLKASQAISGEIELEKLLNKLMQVVIENAGAQIGFLLLQKKREWRIEAEGAIITAASEADVQTQVKALQSLPIEASAKLSVAIVNYVARTRENVVLNNATQVGIFMQDPYIVQQQPKSILCAPLINQGRLTGIIYLENNLTTDAFTPDRLEILNLLSAQAAISIENARLYTHQVALTNGYSRFVPQEILRFLNKESIVDVKLGDQVQQEMAILVSDVRAFTTLSESMTPQENFDFVNAYLGRVSPIVRKHGGLIVKYMGDGMMAVFPLRPEDALNAALEKLHQVALYNQVRRERGYTLIQVGIGIHTGKMMLGTVGEPERMQSDLLSDAVNLTTRLEGLSKEYGGSIIISDEYLQRLPDPAAYKLRFLGKSQVKGRQGLVSIYEVFDADSAQQIEYKLQTKVDWEKALHFYYHNQLTEANLLFQRVLQHNPQDKAAALYLERSLRNLTLEQSLDPPGLTLPIVM